MFVYVFELLLCTFSYLHGVPELHTTQRGFWVSIIIRGNCTEPLEVRLFNRLQPGRVCSLDSGVRNAGAPGAGAPVKFCCSEVEDHDVHARQHGSSEARSLR